MSDTRIVYQRIYLIYVTGLDTVSGRNIYHRLTRYHAGVYLLSQFKNKNPEILGNRDEPLYYTLNTNKNTAIIVCKQWINKHSRYKESKYVKRFLK